MKEKMLLTERANRRRFHWTEKSVTVAYTAVVQSTKTQRQAAKEFPVPRSTLQKLLRLIIILLSVNFLGLDCCCFML